jgi:cytoskeletal protein RodZ
MRFWKYRDGEGPVDANGVAHPASPTTVVHPTTTTVVERTGASETDVRAAYDRGRKDERASRHSHPIITILVVLLAIVGALAIWLLVRNNGSAVRAGIDAQNQAAVVRQEAPGAIHQGVQTVGQAASSLTDKVNKATDASDAPASQ